MAIAICDMATMVDKEFDESACGVLVASQWGERSLSQFFDVPERRLLVAVLVDAMRVMLENDRRERAAVVRWIRGAAARIPFAHLCYNLEIDPDETARRLLRPRVDCRSALRAQPVTTRRVPAVRGTSRAAAAALAIDEADRLSA
jgi:hypothetical protein